MYKIIFTLCCALGFVQAGFSQDAITLSGGATLKVETGGVLFVNGGINSDALSSLQNDGSVILSGNAVSSANFTDLNPLTQSYGTGKFVFIGALQQQLKSKMLFATIEVDNAGLNLESNIQSSSWILTSGRINTGSFIALTNGNTATAITATAGNAGYVNSWFNGKLQRAINPSVENNYVFPVGNAIRAYPAEMDNLTGDPLTGTTAIVASYGSKPGTDVGLNVSEGGIPYTSVNNGGVWYLTPDVNPVSGRYDVKLFFNGFAGLTDNSFGILRRADASITAAEWVVPSGSILPAMNTAGRTVAGGFARRNNLTSFSQFGIGMSSVVLPLQLLSFKATKKGSAVALEWSTTTEINTDHFKLMRSGKSSPMQIINNTQAAGNSNGINFYAYTDLHPLPGINFYQLKIVDKDNSQKLSNIVSVQYDEAYTLKIFPNPVSSEKVFVEFAKANVLKASLVAADGKEIQCSFTKISDQKVQVNIGYYVAKGNYMLKLVTDNGLITGGIVLIRN